MAEIKGSIPTVSQETLEIFYAECLKNPSLFGEAQEAFKNKLTENNPQLCRHISAELSKYPDELKVEIFGTIVSTLRILAKQILTDQLNSNIYIGNESSQK